MGDGEAIGLDAVARQDTAPTQLCDERGGNAGRVGGIGERAISALASTKRESPA